MIRPIVIAIFTSNLLAAVGVVRLFMNIFDNRAYGETLLYDALIFGSSIAFAVLAEKRSKKDTYCQIIAQYTTYFSLSFLFLIFMFWLMNM